MKFFKKIFSLLFILAATASLTGCGIMLNLLLTEYNQTITIEASDGEKYDFYIYEGLVCQNTDKCTFQHDLSDRCDLMVITARRDSIIFGTKEYGYREIPFLLSVLDKSDNKDKYKRCPESFRGADVIVPIDDIVKYREQALQRKRKGSPWDVSPFDSNFGK